MRSLSSSLLALLVWASAAGAQSAVKCGDYIGVDETHRSLYVAGMLDGFAQGLGTLAGAAEVFNQHPDSKVAVNGDSISAALLGRWVEDFRSAIVAEVPKRNVAELVLRLQALCSREENREKNPGTLFDDAIIEMQAP